MRLTIKWLMGALAIIAIAVAAGALIPRPLLPPDSTPAATGQRQIVVLSNPIHTDIAIPLDEAIRTRFAFLATAGVPIDNSGAKYLIIGWGGRSFYLETPHWSDLKPLPVLRALTLDRSVMHVDVSGTIRNDNPSVIRLATDDAGLERMLTFILASFTRDGDDAIPIPAAHYGRYDAFYEANGYFNALLGCNTWTARALREAGLRTGTWNPVPQTLAVSLRLYNRVRPAS